MIISNEIDMSNTMYPSFAQKVTGTETFIVPVLSTVYGYVLKGTLEFENGNNVQSGQYFSLWSQTTSDIKLIDAEAVFFVRYGFKGQNVIGGPLEESGRLCYIDTCSDSLLVYPPRMGDPSLNALYFPTGVDQSFHIHPSIRFGVVAHGSGVSCVKNKGEVREIPLRPGDMFCLEERETHRFRTLDSEMVVIAFHPDGDWGPTDHNHTMLNRTYVTK